VRFVPPENLHVTVAFLGARPREDVDRVLGALRKASSGIEPPVLTPARYRETRSVGMLVLADEGGRATLLADRIGKRLERLGIYRRERRPWLPHITVLRFRERPRIAAGVPELGAVSPSEVALYHSVLRPGGSQYEILESVALGGPVGA
jgi:2'-5' RNA ligase